MARENTLCVSKNPSVAGLGGGEQISDLQTARESEIRWWSGETAWNGRLVPRCFS